MTRNISILTSVLLMLLIVNNSFAQSYKTGKYKSYNSTYSKKPTYNVGGTTYLYGETYKTTGKPKVERSYEEKHEFLKSKGYKKVPPGYQVDHIIPLSQGGKDIPSNMQLITIEQHKQKTARERQQVSSTYNKSYKSYYSPKKSSSYYKSSTYKYYTPKKSYNSKSYSSGGKRK